MVKRKSTRKKKARRKSRKKKLFKRIEELQKEISICKNLEKIETTYVDLLQRFMNDHKNKIEDFILNEWIPAFLEEVNRNTNYRRYRQTNKICK